MINLFTTYHQEIDKNRSKELSMSLNNNILCKEISKIYLFSEVETKDFFDINGIKVIYHKNRPKFEDIFDLINSVTSVNDINIVANADIYFDNSLKMLTNINLLNCCLALTRWDIWKDGRARLTEISESQDAWVFLGKIKQMNSDIPLGIPGCDGRLAYEIKKSGYHLFNPSISIKAYHLHTSEYRPNLDKWFLKDFCIGPPYLNIIPDTLESFTITKITILLKGYKIIADHLYSIKIKRWYRKKELYVKRTHLTNNSQNLMDGSKLKINIYA